MEAHSLIGIKLSSCRCDCLCDLLSDMILDFKSKQSQGGFNSYLWQITYLLCDTSDMKENVLSEQSCYGYIG